MFGCQTTLIDILGELQVNYWPLATEVIALLLIFIIYLHHQFGNRFITKQNSNFRWCLIISAISIIWNMMAFALLCHSELVAVPLHYLVNSGYFIVEFLLCTIVFGSLLYGKVYEHVYNSSVYKNIQRALHGLFGFYALLVLINVKTGWLFSITPDKLYQQGPLNKIGHIVVFFEIAFLLLCYFKNRKRVSKVCGQMLCILIPSLIVLLVIQLVNPLFQMNGSMVALINLILYICFQYQQKQIDSVTELGNRNEFFDDLSFHIAGKQKFQIILFTIRDFNRINRRYGHEKGNEFLYSIASWIRNECPECNTFRFIGVSFVMINPYIGPETSHEYLKKITDRFEHPWYLGKLSDSFQINIGDYIYENESHTANQVMEILDYMLTLVKHSQTAHVHFNKQISENFLEYVRISNLLRSSSKKFQVWYQPIYDPKRRSYSSAEALVRMQDQEGNYVPPDTFIPIAEELGIIDDIFWFVLENSCKLLHDNPQLPLKAVSINMSLPQFENPQLLSRMLTIINHYGLTPAHIKLEITERILSDDHHKTKELIQQMHLAGFCFCLDDFGTGYSNFSSVAQLPLKIVKLDKSLIWLMEKDEKHHTMIAQLIQMFHSFHMYVVAEGIESNYMAEQLKSMAADYLQGYHFSRPMPTEKLLAFFENKED